MYLLFSSNYDKIIYIGGEKMEQIEIKSNWLAFALGARNNKITLDELNNTRILDFDLLEYLRGNSDIYFNEPKNDLTEKEVINETNLFMIELSKLQAYTDFNIERMSLKGMNFADTDLQCLYGMEELNALNLSDNTNCEIELNKLKNIRDMKLAITDCDTKTLDICDFTRESMGLPYGATEYDLYCLTKQKVFANTLMDISDYSTIEKYTDILPTISIKGIDDIRQIKRMNLDNISIGLRTGAIRDLVELSQLVDHVNALVLRQDRNISINQVIDNVSELSFEQLQVIQDKMAIGCEFDNIKVYKAEDCFEEYDIETYGKIVKRIDELTQNIDPNSSDIEKFVQVQNIIVHNILYDREAINDKDNPKYVEENKVDSRNMVNGLLKGKCVCMGYADIFRNMLASVGITSNSILGKYRDDEMHAWNQVKIDYKWYNTDITESAKRILTCQEQTQTLKSDYQFKEYDMRNQIGFYGKTARQCLETYNSSVIEKMYENLHYECTPKYILQVFEDRRNWHNKEEYIKFNDDGEEHYNITSQYENGVTAGGLGAEKKLNEVKTTMCISKDHIGKFFREYLEKYTEEGCKGRRDEKSGATYVTSVSGACVVADDNIRRRLYQEGIIDLLTDEERKSYHETNNIPVGIERDEIGKDDDTYER